MRYTVQGLPYQRTAEELEDSFILRCLTCEEWSCLSSWAQTAQSEEEWRSDWFGEMPPIVVKRVS